MRPSLAIALCLFAPALASAQLLITEIMYDLAEGSDSGREWIEVHNAGAVAAALTEWKLFENGVNHKITTVVGGGMLAPGAYAIIADNAEKFRADHPAFGGQLFDSAFSLSNEGETITLRTVSGTELDSVTYAEDMGAKGTGDSLQRIGADWDAGVPTPGIAVPASGLQKSPPKGKSSRTSSVAGATSATSIIGEPAAKKRAGMTVARHSGATALFLLGAGLLAGVGSVGAVMARARRSDEWEIEEIE